MPTIVNDLLRNWPPHTPAPQSWLTTQGVSKSLATHYCKSGWVEKLGHGLYRRAGDHVSLTGAIHAVQEMLGKRVWLGGTFALAAQGFAHYLPFGRDTAWLYLPEDESLPGWFLKGDWADSVHVVRARLFDPSLQLIPSYLSKVQFDGISLTVSSPELAVFEILEHVPDEVSFEQAADLLQGLMGLRPSLLQPLLEHCRSIKVKRVLLYLAFHYQLPWATRLQLDKISLGNGKRQIVSGGKLDKQFLITVPRSFVDGHS